jgi:glucokinase
MESKNIEVHVLIGDIGGTNSRLSIAKVSNVSYP